MAIGHFLFQDDRTSCGGVITEGMPDHMHFGRLQACEEHSVTCGKHPGLYKIMGGLPDDFIHGRRIAGTLHSRSTCPCRAEFIPSVYTDTYEFIPRENDSGRNTDGPDNPEKTGPRVFAKSCLRPAGCTDAGTEDEPQDNVGEMVFYVSVPASEEDRESARRAWVQQQRMAMSTPPEKSLFDKVSGFFFGEAQANPMILHRLLLPPVGGNSDVDRQLAIKLTTATRRLGENGASKQQVIMMSLPWMLMGAMVYDNLKGQRSDLLTPDKLLEVAIGKGTVPTRVRYRWEENTETGRLKAVGYHTSPASGRDQVRVRLLRKNINGGFDFWGDERADKPLITWTPADPPGLDDPRGWHTGNDAPPINIGALPGLEYPDIKGVTITTTPLPEEKDFRDYILVFPTNIYPPVYVYLSKRPEDPIWTKTKELEPVENAYEHWVKHGKEFPELELNNSKNYVDTVHDFVREPPSGTLTKTRKNGDILYYHPDSNTFAVKTKDGVPKTMFKPETKMDYWEKQK